MLKLFKISILLLSLSVLGQGPSMSLHDLKDAYLEKRTYHYQNEFKTLPSGKQAELDRIVQFLEENGPESFEYHLVKYINGDFDLKYKENLFKAYQLRPDDGRVRLEMFGYYILIGDESKQKEFAKKIKSQFTVNELNYYESMLNSTSAKAIIYSGRQDAYPALIVNILNKTNTKVKIISLDLLQNDSYRSRIASQLKIGDVTFAHNEINYVKSFVVANSSEHLIASTVSQRYLRGVQNDIFLVGYFYQYKTKTQRESLNDFYEKIQPKISLIASMNARDKKLYGNYLPALLTLYKTNLIQNIATDQLKNDIHTLAKILNKTTTVNQILQAYDKLK